MKFIAVLLACVVASQAATSACPSYSYWCANGFRVLPSRSVYCYSVPFKSSWCSAETYADILAEFPKTNADGKDCDVEIADMESYLNGIRQKLADARGKVKDEMMAKKDDFLADVQAVHDDYIATFTRYYKSACADQQADFDEKLEAYKKELAEAKTEAGKNFDKAVEKAVERVAAFHEKIVSSFKSCLDTRACRVESFNTKMDARAADMKKCYEDRVKASVNKRIDWITKVLKKIYDGADATKVAIYEAVIEKYTCDMIVEIAAYTGDYNKKVDAAIAAMKINYRCSYKCYFSTGCYGFNRKTFQRSCVQFPTGQKISYKLVGMGAFKVDWNGSKYSCLRTCDPATNCPAFDSKKHTDAIDAEVAKHTKALFEKVEAWKADVAAWKVKALAALKEEITCMYPRSWCGEEPTKAEIEAFHDKLREQAKKWIDSKAEELLAQIECVNERTGKSITSWKERSVDYIEKVAARHQKCVDNKNKKIADYKECLLNRRNAQRKQLQKRLDSMAERHMCQFNQFFKCSFEQLIKDIHQGQNATYEALKTNYDACVKAKVAAVMAKFEKHWDEWQPQLETHYTCGFKCTTKVTTPTLKLSYNWSFCAPSTSLCRFYY